MNYDIRRGYDSYGKFLESTPPCVTAQDELKSHIERTMRLYYEELNLAIVHELTDEQLVSIINSASAEYNRRQHETDYNRS